MKQSQELTDFYRSYRDWVNSGAEVDAPYTRRCGLCANLKYFHKQDTPTKETHLEMVAQLSEIYAEPTLPFNADMWEYEYEGMNDACHLNAARIEWVESHC